MKKIIVGQSGGPTAVINASVAGVYRKAKELGIEKVYGMVHGIEGFLNEDIIDLDDYLNNKDNFELLLRTPSAFLGTCRYKLPKYELDKKVYEKIFDILEKNEIDGLFYIGGNDSMDTVKMLSDYAKEHGKKQLFVGVPKTIDNDLPITDHCPGYGSAAKYIASSIKEIIRDNESFGVVKPTICIVEIMGRHAGWLTAAASLAKSSVVIAVSEGIKTKEGKFVCELENDNKKIDAFGHKQLSGCAVTLANIISKNMDYKTRAIEFSTLQRAASHISSLTDINEALRVGEEAVKAMNDGNTAVMIVMKRNKDKKYKITYDYYDIHQIANVEKMIPTSWIDTKNKQMKNEYLNYARPLIMGELNPIYKNGLPSHLVRK